MSVIGSVERTTKAEAGIADTGHLTFLTVDIVRSMVHGRAVASAEVADMIGAVHAALVKIDALPPAPVVEPKAVVRPGPAVPIKRSITPDFLICLEDGKRFRSLKRHLRSLGLTPEQYREKWGLPKDYPMSAPNYSVQRSELAKAVGLGTKRATVQ